MEENSNIVQIITIGLFLGVGLLISQNMYNVSVDDFHLVTTTASNLAKIMG